MLPDVKTKILDGAMGIAGSSATGIFAAVGVSAIPSKGILTLVDAGDVDEKIGDGPLRDLIVSALSIARTTVYAIALEGSVAGSLSPVLPALANAGSGTLAVSGSPRNEYDVSVEIISPGGLNDAAFRVTIDGAAGKVITVPDNGQYVIPNTGITLTFSAEDTVFASGDIFTFSSTAPQATNTEVLAAVDTILDAKLPIEWIAVAGISSAPLWAALAAKAESAEAVYQYLFFIRLVRKPD
ncbi:hypothetical protein Holit_01785 [Hollandina sp. SP2]